MWSSHVHGLLLVVGHEDRGDVGLVVQPAQPVAQLLAHAGVERAEGLVEQQHGGLDGQRPGQGHALPLPAGELGRIAVGQVRDLHQRRAARRPRCRISALGRLRMVRPKATLSHTVMCLKGA